MNRKWLAVLGVVLLAAQVGAEEAPALKTMKDKLSYATGVDMARSFQRQGVEVDRNLFLKGVKDGFSGGPLLMSDDDLNKTLRMFQTEQKMEQSKRMQRQSELMRKQRQGAALGGPSGQTRP